ncbi:MAG: DegQ family serine endoprotease [Rhodospirillaceae bacterium]|nr:DegQ family serine endoprotease [Rhodospirillaceae bacterium]
MTIHSISRWQWQMLAMGLLAMMFMAFSIPAYARSAPDSFADMAEKLLPAVVNISTTQVIEGRSNPQMPQLPPGSPFEEFFKDFLERNQPQGPDRRQHKATSLGSGFIIDTKKNGDAYVITNNHVIADADEITVILHDNDRLKAELIGRDAKTDLAVLKIKSTKKMASVSFGNSDDARVGDWVVAIGNPFGLGGTVTAGIISARGRDIQSGPYDNFIQTDASINRGNSGGPLFNMDGEVIGINSAIYSPSGGSVGIGFSIPSSGAQPIINQLINHGQVRRGWLGVHIQGVTEEIAETLGLKKAEGALVASLIKGGPAEDSGLKAGDVILEFDGKPVPQMRKLPRIVAETEVDKPVNVVVWRDGKKKTVKVTIGRLDETEMAAAGPDGGQDNDNAAGGDKMVDPLGLTLAELTPALREKFKLDEKARGVIVTEVADDGVAFEKGIRPGDLIVEVSQQEVTSPDQVIGKIDEARKEGNKRILLLIEGQSGLRFVALSIEKE